MTAHAPSRIDPRGARVSAARPATVHTADDTTATAETAVSAVRQTKGTAGGATSSGASN